MSESVCVPADAVFPLPEHVGLDIGALVEPISVAWHGFRMSPLYNHPDPSQTWAAILGGGPIGLAMILVLMAHDVKNIIVSEVSGIRQKFAKDFGAHHVIDPRTYDLVGISKELSGECYVPWIVEEKVDRDTF